jgi:hypothetical protein
MAFVFHRGLALPLWAMVFFSVALLPPPPTTLYLMVLGIALMAFTLSGLARLRTARSAVRVLSDGNRHRPSGPTSAAAGSCVRGCDKPNTISADALDLGRMDDDGGWHTARPPR